MSYDPINIGTTANDGTGDTLRAAFIKINSFLSNLVKGDVGLGNVDNTSDANKPISTATQTALNLKLDAASYVQHFKGVYASLSALQTAHPSAVAGDYAQVDTGAAGTFATYSFDVQDGWVVSNAGGSGAANTDALAEGSSNLYFTVARVLNTVLAGLSTTAGSVSSGDSVLSAIGKLAGNIAAKQATLVSGTNIKTINGASILGSGDLTVTGGGGGSSMRGLYDIPAMPALSDFTQINLTGTASAIENAGKAITIKESEPAFQAVKLNGLTKDAPVSTPYRVSILCLGNMDGANYSGIAFGWSDGTKFHVAAIQPTGIEIQTYSTYSTRVSVLATLPLPLIRSALWLGIRDDGTNVYFEISIDGANYTIISKVLKSGGYLGSSGYSKIFFGLFNANYTYSSNLADHPLSASFFCYDESGLSRVAG